MALTNEQLRHLFCQQDADSTSDRCAGGGTLAFRGRTLYSYLTPVAMWHWSTSREKVLLVTNDGYSTTTKTKHICHLSSDAHPAAVFFVPYVGRDGGKAPHTPDNFHEANLEHLKAAYADSLAALARKQKDFAEETWLRESFVQRGEQIEEYAQLFGIECGKFDGGADFDRAALAWRAKRLENDTPEKRARREADAARRQARKEAQEADRRAYHQKAIDGWKRGERNHLPWEALSAFPTYLRLKDGDTVQTSRGAEVPLNRAIRLFEACRQCREAGLGSEARMKVGHFELTSIDEHGNATIGCHFLTFEVMDEFARQIGVLVQ